MGEEKWELTYKFDEIWPTKQEGIYEYFGKVLVDYNYFQTVEDELFEIQINNPSYVLPFKGFWNDEHEDVIFKLIDSEDEDYELGQMVYWEDLVTKGYVFLIEEFIKKYPQYKDIFCGFVE